MVSGVGVDSCMMSVKAKLVCQLICVQGPDCSQNGLGARRVEDIQGALGDQGQSQKPACWTNLLMSNSLA